ncbi:MAG: mechanosensitive ion channel domain-containing protein [Candidatus Latescibacterota bacterium]
MRLGRITLERNHLNTAVALGVWLLLTVLALLADQMVPGLVKLPSGRSLLELLGLLAGLLAVTELLILATHLVMAYRGRPGVEGQMLGRVYHLVAVLAVASGVAYGMGALGTFGTFFVAFGGMLLGWSLQAPVSGFAAWVLVSVKRPFRPGDRVQFPSLGLVGDVKETGLMYTYLNQVGGTVASEEAIGRYILVPNAMLFGQVVINYTVIQDSPYMLDEVVVRITYDSDWEKAERILLDAAAAVTGDVIGATGVQPYIRSDLYDYGVYLRLRYQTRVQDRAEISYRITKAIFESVQRERTVDLAIPYVYSYRVGADTKREPAPSTVPPQEVRTLEMDRIHSTLQPGDTEEIEQAAKTMSPEWLRQPIVVSPSPRPGIYQIVAGHLQFEVCRYLGWKTIPAVVVEPKAPEPSRAAGPAPAGTAPAPLPL